MEQRTKKWVHDRIGKVTGSKFDVVNKLPRAKKDIEAGVLTDGQMTYMAELIADVLLKTSEDGYEESEVPALKWGTENEAEAIKIFKSRTGMAVKESPFIPYTGGNKELVGFVGCSPDGIIDDDTIIEVKCPYNPAIHVLTGITKQVPKRYVAQVQGNMWVTGAKKCYFISYDPRFTVAMREMTILEVPRDEEYIAELESNVERFIKVYKETFREYMGMDLEVWLDNNNGDEIILDE